MKTPLALAASALLLASLLASCDDAYGVFKSIQEERKLTSSSMFADSTVTAVAKLGDSYFAATAKLYAKLSSSWTTSPVSFPDSIGQSYRCSGLAADASRVYAALVNLKDEAQFGIYASADGSTWSRLIAPADLGGSADGLFEANGQVFASIKAGSASYSLRALGSGGFGATVLSLSEPPVGVAHDGTDFWYATASKLYTGSAASAAEDGAWASRSTGDSTAPADSITALGAGSKGPIVGGSAGYVYGREAGAWKAPSQLVYSSGKPYRFTSLVEAPLPSGAVRVLAGTGAWSTTVAAQGYLEGSYGSAGAEFSGATYVAGGASGALLSSTTGFDTTVKDGIVVLMRLYPLSGGGKRLLVSVAGKGLYAKTWDGSAWGDWSAE